MNKEEICKNCKYHYIEEISFDYPQSCCNRTNPNYTTEAGLHCDKFEYSEEYMKNQLEAYENMRKEAINHIKTHQLVYISQYEEESNFDNHLLDILNKVGGSDE